MGKLTEEVSLRLADIILVYDHDIIGEGISRATKKLFPGMLYDNQYPCHVEFVKDTKLPTIDFSAEMWGLWERELSRLFKETSKVQIIKDERLSITDRVRMVAIMNKMKGTPYNYGGFFKFLFKRLFGNVDRARMCAENVAEIYQKVGKRISEVSPRHTAPCHIKRYAMDMQCEIIDLWIGGNF